MKPHLSQIIRWYDMLILRYYNPMWYVPEYDEVDYKYLKEVTTDDEQHKMSENEDDSDAFSELNN